MISFSDNVQLPNWKMFVRDRGKNIPANKFLFLLDGKAENEIKQRASTDIEKNSILANNDEL